MSHSLFVVSRACRAPWWLSLPLAGALACSANATGEPEEPSEGTIDRGGDRDSRPTRTGRDAGTRTSGASSSGAASPSEDDAPSPGAGGGRSPRAGLPGVPGVGGGLFGGGRDGGGLPGLPGFGGGQTGATTPDDGVADAPPPSSGPSCLKGSSSDYRANGPYQVKSKQVTIDAFGSYTVFYPSDLSDGCPHPIVSWGNGTGVSGAAVYAHFFRHAASWGLVVIAAHNANAGSKRFIEAGIDYLLKENDTAGSELAGKLSPRAGVAGHSQGGIAATTAATHKNVQAEVCVEGGGLPPAKVAFLCETGTGDFLRAMCTSAYKSARGPAFLADLQGADHISTPTTLGALSSQGAEFVRLFTAWFRCHLGDDAAACGLFKGGTRAPICSEAYATCDGRGL